MDSKKFQTYHLFYMFILASVVTGFALTYTKPVLVPLIFAIFYYFASLPLKSFLENKLRFPTSVSSYLTTFFMGFLSLAFVFQVSISIKNFFWELNTYRNSFLSLLDKINQIAASYGVTIDRSVYYEFISSLPLKSFFADVAGGTFGFIGNALIILLIYFFLMLGHRAPEDTKKPIILDEIASKISRYVIYKVLLSAGTGLLIWLILLSFGVNLAFTFGLLAFLLNFIPSIGSIIATLLPIPILALQFGFGLTFTVVLVLCAFVQTAIGNFLDPKLIGKDLDLHPIVILLSLIFWGLIWGISGAFLAVPLTATLKLFFSKIETTRRFSELLAGRL